MSVGYWSIIVIEDLKFLREISSIGLPSMRILPLDIYVTPSRVLIIVVFPAPVRPTMPTFSPDSILQFIPLMTSGRSFLYLTFSCLNSSAPFSIACTSPSYSGLQFLQYYAYFGYG